MSRRSDDSSVCLNSGPRGVKDPLFELCAVLLIGLVGALMAAALSA
jgi:hypothetical protein